ncbi:MAG: class II aldolase/adducin family protein [Oscillospiraceae bacterium]|nr:class II aldolase/adducin family protein [Oscillospiraceae bacterium]
MNISEMLEVAAHRAYTRGLQTGNGGNLSSRSESGQTMIVKSSGGSFADCDRNGNGFIETDFSGAPVKGAVGKPTREVFLHGLMYRASASVGGVVHTHSPYAIAWSYGKLPLPQVTLHAQLKLGCDIPVLDIHSPSVQPENEPEIMALFEKNPKLPAFILAGHGIVAMGKDVLAAEHMAELIEETAQIVILKRMSEKLGIYY